MRQPPSGIAHPCAFRPAARRRPAGITRERMQPQVPRSPRRPLPPRHAGNRPSRPDGRPPHVLTRPGCHGVRPAVGAAARRLSRRPRPAARPTPRTRRGPQTLRTPDATTDGWDDGEPPNPHPGRGAGEGNMAGKPPGNDRLRRRHPGRRPDFPAPRPCGAFSTLRTCRAPRHALHRSRRARGRAGRRTSGRAAPNARRIGSDRTVERAPRGLLRGTAHGVLVPSLRHPEREALPVPPSTPAAHRLTRVAIGACCSRFRR